MRLSKQSRARKAARVEYSRRIRQFIQHNPLVSDADVIAERDRLKQELGINWEQVAKKVFERIAAHGR